MISRLGDVITEDIHSIAMAGHVQPDGDAIGSCLGVAQYLRKQYPEREIVVYLEHIPDKFDFLAGADQVREAGEARTYDLFITLDCSAIDRLGDAGRYFTSAKHTLCVDHHISKGDFADENYIFPDASSTCELAFDLMDPEVIDRDIAACLYTGIVSDTGMFQYSCTSSKTMNVAGQLMDKGIDYSRIIDDTFQSRTFLQNKILGHALDKAELYDDGAVIVSWISLDEMAHYGVQPADLDLIVSQLRMTNDTQAAAFLYETTPGNYKISLRSNGDLDVAAIAMQYGGGGHKKAAGCSTSLPIDEAVADITSAIAGALRKMNL